jgi:hypothetical protein
MPPPIPARARAVTVPPPIPMRARAVTVPPPVVARGSQGLPIAPPADEDIDIDIDDTPLPPPAPAPAEPLYVQRVAQEWPVVALAEERAPENFTERWFDAPPASETDLVEPVELDKPRASSLRWGVLLLVALAVAAGAYVATRSVAVEPVAHHPVAPVEVTPTPPPVEAPVAQPPATAEPTPVPAVEPAPTPPVEPAAAPAAKPAAAPAVEPPSAAEPPPKVEVVKSTAPPASETRVRSKERSTSAAKRKRAPTRVAVAHDVAAPAPRGPKGTLMISTKPPCEIVIDGVATVLVTPQRAMPLKPGKHKVTLFNDTYNINATVDIVVEPGKTTKLIKDFTAQMRRR